MKWEKSNRANVFAVHLADNHYNRQKPGTPQFVPPGRCLVLLEKTGSAVWVTSWPYAQYVKHAWAGAWVNSIFRNENRDNLSSDLIVEALAYTRGFWGDPPPLGLVSFVDASKIKHKRDPGRCYVKAGAKHVGFTKGGLYVFQFLLEDFPAPYIDSLGTSDVLHYLRNKA